MDKNKISESLKALFLFIIFLNVTNHYSLSVDAFQPSSTPSNLDPIQSVDRHQKENKDDYEYRLTKYLISNYDSGVRPVKRSVEPINVKFDVSIHQIIDVDEKNQILTTNCWLTTIWNDSHLTWNGSDFGNISSIRLPHHQVWKPDVILYNNADSNYNQAIINTNVIVSENGEVVWLSHGIFRSSCDISVEYFPFDVQVCKLKWASWTYDGCSLNLTMIKDGDTTNYQPNGEFLLEAFQPHRHLKFYSCCKEPYIDITYSITLRRRPMFYVFNLILPCALINGIALLVFFVPSESGEKVTLGISALLSMTVFMMTIRESLPPTEKTPLISMYYGVSICLVSFASGLSVVTLNLHHRGSRGSKVPDSIRHFVLECIAKPVCLHFEKYDSVYELRNKRFENPPENKDDSRVSFNSADPSITSSNQVGSSSKNNNESRMRRLKTFMTNLLIPSDIKDNTSSSDSSVLSGGNGDSSMEDGNLRFVQNQHRRNTTATNIIDIDSKDGDDDVIEVTAHQNIGSKLGSRWTKQDLNCSTPQSWKSTSITVNKNTQNNDEINMMNMNTPSANPSEVVNNALMRANSFASRRRNQMGLGRIGHVNSVDESNYDPKLSRILDKLDTGIDRSELRHKMVDARDSDILEWKQVALVLDRVLLLIFFLAMSTATVVILTSSPHLYDMTSVQDTNVAKTDEGEYYDDERAVCRKG